MQNQNQNALAVAEVKEASFPVATTAKERFTIDGNATWRKQRQALGITKDTPKETVKKAQAEFMGMKRAACKQARALAAGMVSNDGYGIRFQSWQSKKGIRNFAISGKEIIEEEEKGQQLAIDAALSERNAELRQKLLKAGLTDDQVNAILSK